jgi:hypothetical protein
VLESRFLNEGLGGVGSIVGGEWCRTSLAACHLAGTVRAANANVHTSKSANLGPNSAAL